MNNRPPSPTAFSMVEVLAAIAIIGVITFLAVPNIVRVKQDGEDNLARSRAEALNVAIASLIQASGGAAAQTAWSGSTTDVLRYNLLRGYVAFSETNWAAYMPAGYGVTNWPTTINPPNNKVRAVRQSDSTILF